MSQQIQSNRRKIVIEVIYPDRSRLHDSYDKKKLEEYKKIADEGGNYTEYEMKHINDMYEKIMKSKYGTGATESKRDPGRMKLRYGR